MYGYLRPLAYFADTVEAGSITAAANRLGVSPSVVSEAIRVLETRLGVPLLERRRSGVVPTARGMEVAGEAQKIVGALRTAFADDDDAIAPSGPVALSLPSEASQGWFDTALADVAHRYPSLHLEVHVEDTILDYAKFTRDLYIRVSPKPSHPGLTALTSGETRVVLVAARALVGTTDRVDPKSVAGLPLLCGMRREGAQTIPLRGVEGQSEISFATLRRVSDLPMRIALARSGLGAVACLLPSVADDLANGTLVSLLPGQVGPPKVYIVVGSPHRRPPPKARAVAECLSSALARLASAHSRD